MLCTSFVSLVCTKALVSIAFLKSSLSPPSLVRFLPGEGISLVSTIPLNVLLFFCSFSLSLTFTFFLDLILKNFNTLSSKGYKIAGQIKAPGTLEGGDFIWIDNHHAAVGLGPRTNAEGIRQLKEILGSSVELHVVNLPEPSHPDDVLHLMSII